MDTADEVVISVNNLDVFYGEFLAVKNVSMEIKGHSITCLLYTSDAADE